MNGVQIVTGSRVVMGTPLIPFKYLTGQSGNFIFTGTTLDEVYYTFFGFIQQLFYLSYAEMTTIPASPANPLAPSDFSNDFSGAFK